MVICQLGISYYGEGSIDVCQVRPYSSLCYLQSHIDTVASIVMRKIRWEGPRRNCGSTSNSVTTEYLSFTELKEAISEVSRALIDLSITKDDVFNA